MPELHFAYLRSLLMNDIPETEENLIDQAYARFVYLIDNDSVSDITDADEYLFHDEVEAL